MFILEEFPPGRIVIKQRTMNQLRLFVIAKGEVIPLRNESEESLSHMSEIEKLIIISLERDIIRASKKTMKEAGTEWVPDTPLPLFTKVVNFDENKNLNHQLRKVLAVEDESYVSRIEQDQERFKKFVQNSPDAQETQEQITRIENYVRQVLSRTDHFSQKEVLKKSEQLDPNCAHPLVMLAAKKYLGSVLRPMTAGDIFGERALQGNYPRTASVFSRTNCCFLTINQDDYNTFLKREQFLERARKQRILYENFPGSSSIPDEIYCRFDRLFEAINA